MSEKPMTPSEQLEYVQKLAAYYNQNGEDALYDDIIKSVEEQKKSGKLTDEMIIAMTSNIARFLSPEQRNKLLALVEKITDKKIE